MLRNDEERKKERKKQRERERERERERSDETGRADGDRWVEVIGVVGAGNGESDTWVQVAVAVGAGSRGGGQQTDGQSLRQIARELRLEVR